MLALCAAIAGTRPPQARAQATPTATPVPQQPEVEGEDADPTRPIVWSLREEYYNLRGDSWTNVFIFRSDRAFFKTRPRLGGKTGLLMRFDIPVAVNQRGGETRGGLGDLYLQALYLPYLTRTFGFAAGAGLSLPTATDEHLGTGKFTVAPLVAPIWFFRGRGFFLVKLQDSISVAGDPGRPDVHYLTTTPILVWRVRRRWWIQLETEAKTNWQASGHTGYKSGLLVGRVLKGRLGVWVKPEVYWGRYREGDFVIKTSIFRVRSREGGERDRPPHTAQE